MKTLFKNTNPFNALLIDQLFSKMVEMVKLNGKMAGTSYEMEEDEDGYAAVSEVRTVRPINNRYRVFLMVSCY